MSELCPHLLLTWAFELHECFFFKPAFHFCLNCLKWIIIHLKICVRCGQNSDSDREMKRSFRYKSIVFYLRLLLWASMTRRLWITIRGEFEFSSAMTVWWPKILAQDRKTVTLFFCSSEGEVKNIKNFKNFMNFKNRQRISCSELWRQH